MTTAPKRFLALDTFRGITICFMIIVNTPGNSSTTFSPLLHANWNGFTPTDLVFPSFLFAVGNAMSFVMPKWNQLPQSKVLWKIFRRTFIIFLLGYLMYWFPFFRFGPGNHMIGAPFADTRVFGVLQRIALCYGIASLLFYYFKPKTVVIISIFLLLLYWALLYALGDPNTPLSLEGNAVLRIDRWLLGDKHLYHGEGVAFDPEGLLSTLPSIGNVVGGYMAGRFIQRKGGDYEGLSILLLSGVALIFAGYCWDLIFPINKKLWTSSFVLYTVGLDCVILSVIIYITQFLNKTRWTYFFEVFGRNPLPIYLLSELVVILLFVLKVDSKTTVFHWLWQSIFSHLGGYAGSLLFALCFMLFCWLVGYVLDKKRIYIRV
ncbi:MAG: heparan-alpha-glucosaminide N-acetyltransferase domain-containing protein [Ferruginibacter sp.]